jgi:hypothetical protein
MGEIRIPIMGTRKGVCGRLNPQAARVPKPVARIVAKNPMITLFFIE